MASTKVCKLELPEVYDIARKVGEEFQRIIGEFGGRCVATLVPTVIEALEYLEIYVEEYQSLQTRNYKLLLENDSLAMEREQRIRLATENEVSKRSEIYVHIHTYDDVHTSPSHLVLLIRFLPGTATYSLKVREHHARHWLFGPPAWFTHAFWETDTIGQPSLSDHTD